MAKEQPKPVEDDLGSAADIFKQPETETVEQTVAPVETGGQVDLAGSDDTETPVDDTPAGPSLLDRVRGFGIAADDEQAALGAMADRYDQTYLYVERVNQRMQTLEQQNKELVSYLARTGQQQAVAPQAPSAPVQEDTGWRGVKPLGIPDKIIRAYQNTDGSWRDNTPAEILTEVERYRTEAEQWLEQAMHQPEQFFRPGIEAVVRQMLSEGLQQHERQVTTKTRYQQMTDEVRPYLYAQDPRTGQYNQGLLSEFGVAFSDAVLDAEEMIRAQGREPTQEETFQLAYWRMKPVLGQIRTQPSTPAQQAQQAPPTPAPTPTQVRDERQRQHMRQGRAAGVPQTAGSTAGGLGEVERPLRRQNPLLSVGAEFAQSLYADGGIG